MTFEYDWNAILEQQGDPLLAPSCLQLLDRSLSVEETQQKFWDAMEDHYARVGYGPDSRTQAYKASGRCDYAVMNLVATHYGNGIKHENLSTIFSYDYDDRTIRRFIILLLMVEDSPPSFGASSALLIVAAAKAPQYRKYGFETEIGCKAMLALARFTSTMLDNSNRILKRKLFVSGGSTRTPWFTDEEIVELVLNRPDDWEKIAAIVTDRRGIDTGVIRDVLDLNVSAISSGVL